MVHHIVSWKFQEGYTEEEKLAAAAEFRSRIDKVTEVMDGCKRCDVIMPLLDTSSAEIMLHGVYDSKETLAAYQVHPLHLKAVEIIKQYCCDRTCCDYEE
ncbi:MAG: Dabb family protein [Lachnospiraceae bacterium]|nr:Dabb family protein [Lachnospiraceae bacterium]